MNETEINNRNQSSSTSTAGCAPVPNNNALVDNQLNIPTSCK